MSRERLERSRPSPGFTRLGDQSELGKGRLRLEGKVALVTGASSGIGHAIAQLFAREGAQVAAISRLQESAHKWSSRDDVLPVQADLTNAAHIEQMFDKVERELGDVEILCNVAGMNDFCCPLDATSDELWDDVLNLDLTAPFRTCRRAVTRMVHRGGGVILNVGSYAALRGNHGPSYTAAKHGLTGLSMSIAVRYAKDGIRCNVLNPGGVDTPLHDKGKYHPSGLQMFKEIVANFPIRLVCDPEEIAPTALFLCSDEAKHVNGAVVAVDGGMSAC